MKTLKAQDDAFQAHFMSVYPQFARNMAVEPVLVQIEPDTPPEPVIRDVIHIQSPISINDSEAIIDAVCVVSGFRKSEIKSPRRDRGLTRWRQIAAWLLKKHTSASYVAIGNRLGGRDHTTMMHAFRKIETDMDAFRADIQSVERLLCQIA